MAPGEIIFGGLCHGLKGGERSIGGMVDVFQLIIFHDSLFDGFKIHKLAERILSLNEFVLP